jgi:hypothetical protein
MNGFPQSIPDPVSAHANQPSEPSVPLPVPTPSESLPEVTPEPPENFHYAMTDADGFVVSIGSCSPVMEAAIRSMVPPNQQLVQITNEQVRTLRHSPNHKLINGELVSFTPAVDLNRLRLDAMERVDKDAERARMRFLTSGAGQMIEYQETEADARAYLNDPTIPIESLPFLKAEVDALDETGVQATALAVAESIADTAAGWRQIGADIKRLRRTAKLAIESASTAQEITAAVNIDWPTPE